MKHKWIKNKDFIPISTGIRGYKTVEEAVCSVCRCKRTKTVSYKFSMYQYERSQIVFDYKPECIDWSDRDLLNKID